MARFFLICSESASIDLRRIAMRKLWVKAWTTLDGVFDADTMDDWWQNTNSPERMRYVTEEDSNGDAYLLRGVTYEMLWRGWSTQTTGDGPGPLLNRMKKYVVSTTLSAAPWKESTIITENVVEEITKLKQQPGKDIIIDGSATLVRSLMGTDLIDEYRFLVLPFIMTLLANETRITLRSETDIWRPNCLTTQAQS